MGTVQFWDIFSYWVRTGVLVPQEVFLSCVTNGIVQLKEIKLVLFSMGFADDQHQHGRKRQFRTKCSVVEYELSAVLLLSSCITQHCSQIPLWQFRVRENSDQNMIQSPCRHHKVISSVIPDKKI